MRLFSCNFIPDVQDWVDNGPPCPFCGERMSGDNVHAPGYTDLIVDVVFYCFCDANNLSDEDVEIDHYYNYQTLEEV